MTNIRLLFKKIEIIFDIISFFIRRYMCPVNMLFC